MNRGFIRVSGLAAAGLTAAGLLLGSGAGAASASAQQTIVAGPFGKAECLSALEVHQGANYGCAQYGSAWFVVIYD
ncbi:hypothetical protein [Streptomyces fuscigenes]|uniref:hypothetical protein n=1 Tax=Streptomyces fuscigenes TaxID=1528880 RepID=UPI001F3A0AEC|nr:hypothetical protein [Streptomyces fuscigenes]MCF3961228.1 hypothetical protein [Streptomyces fuscigenes]